MWTVVQILDIEEFFLLWPFLFHINLSEVFSSMKSACSLGYTYPKAVIPTVLVTVKLQYNNKYGTAQAQRHTHA